MANIIFLDEEKAERRFMDSSANSKRVFCRYLLDENLRDKSNVASGYINSESININQTSCKYFTGEDLRNLALVRTIRLNWYEEPV